MFVDNFLNEGLGFVKLRLQHVLTSTLSSYGEQEYCVYSCLMTLLNMRNTVNE